MATHEPFGPTVARRVVVLVTFITVSLIAVGSCAAKALAMGYGIPGLTEERAKARLLAVCR